MVKTSRQAKILRGIQGSGKSTYARKLRMEVLRENLNATTAVCSADTHFEDETGSYKFNKTELGAAHGASLRKYVEALQNGVELVIVDNTNTMITEIAPYASLAVAYGYDLEIITIVCDSELGAARNIHDVPKRNVEDANKRLMRTTIPSHWKHTIIEAGK